MNRTTDLGQALQTLALLNEITDRLVAFGQDLHVLTVEGIHAGLFAGQDEADEATAAVYRAFNALLSLRNTQAFYTLGDPDPEVGYPGITPHTPAYV